MIGKMECSDATDIGKKRDSNEDQFLISDVSKSMRVHRTSLALDHHTRLFGETKGKLLLVADGMGGHEAGERASQLVIDSMVDHVLNRLSWFLYDTQEDDAEFEKQLKQGLLACQRTIERETSAIPQRRGMGSTLTLAYIVWPRMFVVHVGDSRCYLLRDGMMQRLTRDHTVAALSEASLGVSDTNDHEIEGDRPGANLLYNIIGGDVDPHPDALALDLKIGDTLLLCTDGLNKHLSNSKIHDILQAEADTDAICERLIAEANRAGGSDNTTVVVSRFSDKDVEAEACQEVELPLEEGNSALLDTVDIPSNAEIA